MKLQKHLAALLLTVLLVSGSPTVFAQKAKPSAGNFGNVEGITAKQLRDYLTFIASDELEGRDTPSRGLEIAALYIAQHLSSWGLKPGGEAGTYFQKVPLRINKLDPEKTQLDVNGQKYVYGKDFLASTIGSNIAASKLVFAGSGWVVKSKNLDPYKGIDVKDKIIIVANSLPKGVTFNDIKGPAGVDWFSPAHYAQQNGAKAVITFPTFNSLTNWDASRWTQSEKGAVEFGTPQTQITVPTLNVTPRMLNILFQGEKFSAASLFAKSAAGEPLETFELKPAKNVGLTISTTSQVVHTRNVIGILEGTDPVLKSEYVAIGAHYDHVGVNPYAPGPDKIWNGADDDGSGTVSVMAIAEAFSKGTIKPRRSILFIWHAGEEHGLWGSDHFTSNPTVPITSIITQLNIDMIGRYQNPGDENHPQNKNLPKPGEIFTIGSKLMSTELGELSDSVNKAFLNLKFNTKYDAPDDPEQFFYRSDHFNYAKRGVPIIFFMDGSHEDYHQPSDTIEKINFEQMEKVARTIMATGWELANRAKRPTVDKPLPASITGNN